MGKSNRIRNDRANATLASVKTPKKKKGMPSWALNLITIVVAALILFSVVFGLMTANGVFGRMRTAVKSDHFRVNQNMMQYFFQTTYQNYVSDNSAYLSYMGLNTGLALKDQTYSTGENAKTWFDVMMDQTKASVEELLVWCEEAEARDIKLTSDEKKAINEQVDSLNNSALNSGYTLAMMYGEGVTKKDVRDCMRLSALASKCTEAVGVELENAILDADIEKEFNENSAEYEFVDMLTYELKVTFSDIEADAEEGTTDEKLIEMYADKINDAKAKAEALSKAADEATFKNLVAQYAIDDIYDDALETTKEDTELDGEALKKYSADAKTKLVAHILDLVQNAKAYDEAAAVAVIEGVTDENETAFIKELAKEVYDDTKSAVDGTVSEGRTKSDSDEMLTWAFDGATAVGSKKVVQSGDTKDGAAMPEGKDNLDFFSAEVGMLTKAKYRQEELAKNVAIMVFETLDEANAAIARLTAGMTYDSFKAIGDELGGSVSDYANYTEGSLGVSSFDTWLYGGIEVGAFTSTAISYDESTYIVALYYGDGEPEWKVAAKNAVFSDRYTAKATEITNTHRPNFKFYGENEVFNAKVLAKIDG